MVLDVRGQAVCIWWWCARRWIEGDCNGAFQSVLQWYGVRSYRGVVFGGLMEEGCAGTFQGFLLVRCSWLGEGVTPPQRVRPRLGSPWSAQRYASEPLE